MNKSDIIRQLYAQGLKPREIADRVRCQTAYVRVVIRQRGAGTSSEADRRYLASPKGKISVQVHKQSVRARVRTLAQTADMAKVRRIARAAFSKALGDGLSLAEAQVIHKAAWHRAIRDMGNHEAAEAAAKAAREKYRGSLQQKETESGTAERTRDADAVAAGSV